MNNTDSQLFRVLDQSRQVFWAENAQLTEDERRQLWTARWREMEMQLCGPPSTPRDSETSTPATISTTGKRTLGRALSSGLPPSKRRVLDSQVHGTEALHRHASTSGAPTMSRKSSLKLRKPDGAFMTDNLTVDSPDIASPTAPANIDTSLPLEGSAGIDHYATHAATGIRDFSPEEFLSSVVIDDTDSSCVIPIPHQAVSTATANYGYASPNSPRSHDKYVYVASPTSTDSESMTRASTLSSVALSRTATVEHACPIDMLRVKTNVSTAIINESPSLVPISKADEAISFFPASFPSDFLFDQFPPAVAPEVPQFSSSPFLEPCLSSSSSSTTPNFFPLSTTHSASSECSSPTRNTQRSQDQITRATRPIAPKVKLEEHKISPAARMVRMTLPDGRTKEMAEIPKSVQPRPSKMKTYCTQCDDRPEGYSGEHELRRHMERVHAVERTVWVCRDISPDGKFLANCKACRAGKTYGQTYNAAAHLRRTHFHPSKNRRGGRGKVSEKRGGKGGGKDPPMEELREWMYQVTERVPLDSINHSLVSAATDSDDDGDDFEAEDAQNIGSGAFDLAPSEDMHYYGTLDQPQPAKFIPRQAAALPSTSFMYPDSTFAASCGPFDPQSQSFLDQLTFT